MLEHSGEVSLRFLSGDDAQGGGANVATKDVAHWMSEWPMCGCDVWRMDPSTSRFSVQRSLGPFFRLAQARLTSEVVHGGEVGGKWSEFMLVLMCQACVL